MSNPPHPEAAPSSPVPSRQSLRWPHKLLLGGFGVLVALLLAEVAAHRLGLLPTLSDAQVRAVSCRAGELRPPYDRFIHSNAFGGDAEFEVEIRLNKLGFRGDDIAARPPDDSQRLLIIGDSYAAGWEVPDDAMWSAWLSRALTSASPSYDVANIGFPGLGTDREFLLYQAYGRTLNPDVVILVIYVQNDVYDNGIALWISPEELARSRPYFTLDDQGRLVEHPWQCTDTTRSYEDAPYPRRAIGWLNAHSLTYRALRDAARAVWSAVNGDDSPASSPKIIQPADLAHPTAIPQPLEVIFSEPDEKWQQSWQITGELLRSFRAAVEADGARLVAVIVPPHMIVQQEHWPYASLFADSGRAWDLWYPQHRMMALLGELSIPALDPTQAFIDFHNRTGQDLFFTRDRHFNRTGTCVFGVLLADWLIDQGIVEPGAASSLDPLAACS